MASLAGLLHERGSRVSGSDENVYPPMSDLLATMGLDVLSPYAPDNLPDDCGLVVVGNALSRGNPELEAVLSKRLPYASMPEVLKEVFLRDRTPVVVAGTHGKTTTSSLVAWLLEGSGQDPGFLVGGIPRNFGVSYRIGSGAPFVVEGDEYDTAFFDKGPKFLHYLPHVAILGNVEFDHADIYRDVEDVARAFRLFVNLIPRNGLLVAGVESERAATIAAGAPCPVATFSVTSDDADWSVELLSSDERESHFRIRHENQTVLETRAPFWGDAAMRNVLAAVAVADHLGARAEDLSRALSEFEGVRRRLDVLGVRRGVTVVDDFAHHPTAIRETIFGARRRFRGRKITAVFEPRSFTTRSCIFQDELAEALSAADGVVVSEVFRSARLPENEELSEEELVKDLRARGLDASFIPSPEAIARAVSDQASSGDVVLIMSNGGFGGLHEKLLDALGEPGPEPS